MKFCWPRVTNIQHGLNIILTGTIETAKFCNLNEHLGIDIIIEIASFTSTWLWEIQMKYQAKLTTSCLQVKHVMSVTLFRHYC